MALLDPMFDPFATLGAPSFFDPFAPTPTYFPQGYTRRQELVVVPKALSPLTPGNA
jgi:hypothetical protein